MERSPARLLVLISAFGQSHAWPGKYTDCRAFPMLGEPQKRFKGHPSVGLKCEPLSGTTFEWCMENCSITGSKQSCDTKKCTCEEKCFSDPTECATHHQASESETDTLSARAGSTALLVNGEKPSFYTPGASHRIKVVPGTNAVSVAKATGTATDLQRAGGSATHFLMDIGTGTLSEVGSIASWQQTCDGTRAGFKASEAVELEWQAPSTGQDESVVLRIAAATSKGDISVNSVVLTSKGAVAANAVALNSTLSSQGAAYACAISEGYTHQCLRVPVGTSGATDQASCATQCAPHRCGTCKHVYFPDEDGDGLSFEDLPESWTCPVCGKPKSQYSKALPDTRSPTGVHV